MWWILLGLCLVGVIDFRIWMGRMLLVGLLIVGDWDLVVFFVVLGFLLGYVVGVWWCLRYCICGWFWVLLIVMWYKWWCWCRLWIGWCRLYRVVRCVGIFVWWWWDSCVLVLFGCGWWWCCNWLWIWIGWWCCWSWNCVGWVGWWCCLGYGWWILINWWCWVLDIIWC